MPSIEDFLALPVLPFCRARSFGLGNRVLGGRGVGRSCSAGIAAKRDRGEESQRDEPNQSSHHTIPMKKACPAMHKQHAEHAH